METVYDNEYVSIFLEKNKAFSYISYKKSCPDDEDRKAMLRLVELAEEHGLNKHIADVAKMGVAPIDTQKWVGEVLMPRLVKNAVSLGKEYYSGNILGDDVFVKMAITNMVKHA